MASLEELRKRLYRDKEDFGERMAEPDLSRPASVKKTAWSDDAPPPPKNNRILWIAIISGVLIVGGAAFFFFGGSQFFDQSSIGLEIVGNREITSGDRVTWQVRILNKNRVDLDDAILIFNFPQGAQNADISKSSASQLAGAPGRVRKSLGAIRAGESVAETFDAYVFGGKDSKKQVTAVLEYRPSGASAIFAKDAEFSFSIVRSPVSVSFKIPEELRNGQQVEFEVHYSSQSQAKIENMSLKIDFPPSFQYASANPAPAQSSQPSSAAKNIWNIGDLKPAQNGIIKIKGVIRGNNIEPQNFHAQIGTLDSVSGNFSVLDETNTAVQLRSPFMDVAMTLSGNTVGQIGADKNTYFVSPGDIVNYRILWRNNLPREITNAILEVKLDDVDKAIDFAGFKVEGGSYRESIKGILWNSSSHAPFKLIAPSAAGELTFSYKIKNNLPLYSDSKRPVIKATASFRPTAAISGFENVDISGSSAAEVKVSSSLQISSRALYFNSAISNTGPMPPKVGEETTYTIIWSLANMVNDLDGVVVRSSLPPNIDFKSVISPADANVVFDSSSGSVEWRVGKVLAGTGFLRPATEVSFKIGLTPSPDQVGKSPLLINRADAGGRDTFTTQVLKAEASLVTTDLQNDPGVDYKQRRVIQ